MPTQEPLNIAIVGGSLAGLSTAIVLSRQNHKITILERTHTSHLHNQGAGIVAGPCVQDIFAQYDDTKTPITVASQIRQYLNHKGEVIDSKHQIQKMTSWDLLYNVLRRGTDGGGMDEYFKDSAGQAKAKRLKGKGTGNMTYLYGCKVTDLKPAPPSTFLPSAKPNTQTSVIYTDQDGKESRLTADIVIGADGPSSTIRNILIPNVERNYAGYVAWRGTVPETEVSPSTLSCFAEKFTFFHTSGVQILAYLIPGTNGTVVPGQRLINYVWYCNYAARSKEYEDLMTDSDGKNHAYTLPAGKMQAKIWQQQKEFAKRVLPKQFSEIIVKTETPFIQAVTDVICPGGIVESKGERFGGTVVLVGDAVAGFRPHTAGSTGQACWHALTLGKAKELVGDEGEMTLADWEDQVMAFARRRQKEGVEMGDRSQFGEHPLADNEYDIFATSIREK